MSKVRFATLIVRKAMDAYSLEWGWLSVLILYSAYKVFLIVSIACQMAKPANSPKDRRYPAILWDSLVICELFKDTAVPGWQSMVGRELTCAIYDGGWIYNTHITGETTIQWQSPIETTTGQMLTLVWKVYYNVIQEVTPSHKVRTF